MTTNPIQQAQDNLMNEDEALQLAELFKSLANPTRVRLIAALYAADLCVEDLAALLGMSHSAISHQLRVLRHLRLVNYTKDGRHAIYRLQDDHVRDMFQRSREHLNC